MAYMPFNVTDVLVLSVAYVYVSYRLPVGHRSTFLMCLSKKDHGNIRIA